ncbi:MAG: flagellar motor switch protein FliN [Armatimonadetes bacterium]|nr:flagellar motor switch protein FliN [Armatimonadota bacterium]
MQEDTNPVAADALQEPSPDQTQQPQGPPEADVPDVAEPGAAASTPAGAESSLMPPAPDMPSVPPSPEALAAMMDVPLQVTVELGRVSLPLADVLALQVGSVVDLDRDPGEPLDLLVNGRPIARGQIVVVNDTLAFHITQAFGQAAVQSAAEAEGGAAHGA